MTPRTPRRRISPRTRQRYRAIKSFFKRAIGSSSQPDLEINSSAALNVTDLKHKIVGLEQQLSEVSRTCREFIYLDGSRRESQSLIPTELKDLIRRDDSVGVSTPCSLHGVETKLLYKTSENRYKNSDGSDCTPKHKEIISNQNDKITHCDKNTTKSKKKKSKVDSRIKNLDMSPNFRKHKAQSAFENVGSTYSTSSFHSLSEMREVRHSNPGYSGNQTDRRAKARETEHNINSHRREESHKEQLKILVPKNYEVHREEKAVKHSKNRKSKRGELDQDFIADIIKRQYQPVQMFGRRESDISQISEPMCRDREFIIKDNIQEDTELCSCCYGGWHSPKHHRHRGNSDTKSVCDIKLHNIQRNPRFKYRKAHADAYDSELYDLIPVKEKSSPRTRRKFFQDNIANYHDYREVPPSPRTHRPRLNLKAQYYTGSEDHIDFVREHNRKKYPKMHDKYEEPIENDQNYYSSPIYNKTRQQKLIGKSEQTHPEIGTMSSLQYPRHFDIEHNNTSVDAALNNTQETVSSTDKTDRALFEIKDILQSFLQEIKKETSSSGKSDVSTKTTENCESNPNPNVNANFGPNSGHSYNYGVPQCSSAPTPYIMPPYPNTCCYPIVPMYSVNCMQNGYVMPTPSFTCACANTDNTTDKTKTNTTKGSETFATETDELIKEIYKFVAQSPIFSRKQDVNVTNEHQTREAFDRVYTTRSAGGSANVSKHDANVGTPKMKSFSKSCEAIGSRMITDTYYSESNEKTYSDSVMENLSLEATATASFVTELSTGRSEKQMSSPNTKIGKVLRSFGFFKKKKKDVIEEVSESESIEVEVNRKAPFRKEVNNYMMYNQVYDRMPPAPQDYPQSQYPYPHNYQQPHNPAMQNYPPPPRHDPYYDPRMYQQEQPRDGGPNYPPGSHNPSAPPHSKAYDSFNQLQSQVPLCLKEIEVKSMGTQSERKMSFFRKIKQKMQPPNEETRTDGANNLATQTQQEKPWLWKSLQTKALEEPVAYSLKQQQKLASSDNVMRNVMLKKMFYKRNPFSPRNIMVKTLLGKDKSSYAPPKIYKPRMFM